LNFYFQFISIVVNLLDALKTSFSHRSLNARSMGRKDSVADAAIASLSMLKGYVKTYNEDGDKCMQKYLCEANEECSSDVGGASIFCQLGSYATSFLLERQSGYKFESLYEAGRKGRSGVDCKQIYLECNQV
jgi:DM4/DM12 family